MSQVEWRRTSRLGLWAAGAILAAGGVWLLWPDKPWLALALLYGAFLIRSASELPDPMASHFDFRLQADNQISRRTYLALVAGLSSMTLVLLMATSLNVGNARVSRLLVLFAVAFLCLMCSLHALVVRANRHTPAKLSKIFWAILAAFLASIWLIALS